jgi:hypothetical protein
MTSLNEVNTALFVWSLFILKLDGDAWIAIRLLFEDFQKKQPENTVGEKMFEQSGVPPHPIGAR